MSSNGLHIVIYHDDDEILQNFYLFWISTKYIQISIIVLGESCGHTPPEVEASVVIKQASSCSTLNSYNSRSPSPHNYCAATLNLNDPSE